MHTATKQSKEVTYEGYMEGVNLSEMFYVDDTVTFFESEEVINTFSKHLNLKERFTA